MAGPVSAATSRSILLVHPGALAADVWAPVTASLPGDVGVHLVDLQKERRYLLAAVDPRVDPPSVDELADTVAQALRQVRPAVVVGWSFGGVVAQAALARGDVDQPAALVLLDSIAPVPELVMEPDFDRRILLEWFGQYLCAKQGVRRPTDPVPAEPDEAMLAWCVRAGAFRPGTSVDGLRKVYQAYLGGLHRNNEIVRRHRAVPHPTPTWLVRPTAGLLADRDLGWSQLQPTVQTVPCGGDHYSMFAAPEVPRLLDQLLSSASLSGGAPSVSPSYQ